MGQPSTTQITLDIKTAFEVDRHLREGLAAGGLIPPTEARDIRSPTVSSGEYEVALDLDPKTAAALSELLRDGIVKAAGAHQANNISVAAAVGPIAQGP